MSNIFLTAARITAGSSDNKIPEHKSSLHRRWRFFMSRKRVAIERKSMVMSQKNSDLSDWPLHLPSFKKTTKPSHFLKLSQLFPSLFCQFYHAFLPIERHPVFKDIPIPFLPQRFIILLLLDLIQRFITLFFQPLIRL